MGLCAPNYNPEDVSFKKFGILYMNALSEQFNIKNRKKEMLDEDQKKIIVDQLEKRLFELKEERNSCTNSSAYYGAKLHKCITEIDNLEDVLESFKDDKDEE